MVDVCFRIALWVRQAKAPARLDGKKKKVAASTTTETNKHWSEGEGGCTRDLEKACSGHMTKVFARTRIAVTKHGAP